MRYSRTRAGPQMQKEWTLIYYCNIFTHRVNLISDVSTQSVSPAFLEP